MLNITTNFISDFDGALHTINQSLRLVEKSIADANASLTTLYEQQEESMVIFEANNNNFAGLKTDKDYYIASRIELESMIDFLCEAKHFISNLKDDIIKQQHFDREERSDDYNVQHELAT